MQTNRRWPVGRRVAATLKKCFSTSAITRSAQNFALYFLPINLFSKLFIQLAMGALTPLNHHYRLTIKGFYAVTNIVDSIVSQLRCRWQPHTPRTHIVRYRMLALKLVCWLLIDGWVHNPRTNLLLF